MSKALELIAEMESGDYETWSKKSKELNDISDETSAVLKKVSGDNTGGMTPDSVRDTKEFKDAKRAFDIAFKNLRDFNKKSPKEFQKRHAQERRASRGKK